MKKGIEFFRCNSTIKSAKGKLGEIGKNCANERKNRQK